MPWIPGEQKERDHSEPVRERYAESARAHRKTMVALPGEPRGQSHPFVSAMVAAAMVAALVVAYACVVYLLIR